MIKQYIRDKKGNKRGVVVALYRYKGNMGSNYSIGYSLCNKADKFDKVDGTRRAYARALQDTLDWPVCKDTKVMLGTHINADVSSGKVLQERIRSKDSYEEAKETEGYPRVVQQQEGATEVVCGAI